MNPLGRQILADSIGLVTGQPGTHDAEDGDAYLGSSRLNETEDEMSLLGQRYQTIGIPPEVGELMKKPPLMLNNRPKRKAEAHAAVANLRYFDLDKLKKRIMETQVEMEGVRKETEASEKKAPRKANDLAR